MSTDALKKKRRLILSPEKSFDLPVYAEQLASAFQEFGTSKSKRRNPSYALNVLQFIDGSASEGRETSNSSSDIDSATESTAT
jgi:hypothetical protein